METRNEISKLCSDFERYIRKHLDETRNEYEKRMVSAKAETRAELADLIQRTLDFEPDANLRNKFQRLVEIIRREEGNMSAEIISIKMTI